MLSKREIEVLELLASGFTCKEIGNQLCISEKTAITHKYHCIKKLQAKNVCHLVSLAMVKGYLSEKQFNDCWAFCE